MLSLLHNVDNVTLLIMSPPVDNNVDVGQKKIGDGKRGNCDLPCRPNIAPLDPSWNVDALGMTISASTIQTRRSEPGRISFIYYTYKQQDAEKKSINAPSICLQQGKNNVPQNTLASKDRSQGCVLRSSANRNAPNRRSPNLHRRGTHDVKSFVRAITS